MQLGSKCVLELLGQLRILLRTLHLSVFVALRISEERLERESTCDEAVIGY